MQPITKSRVISILRGVLSQPTAPFHESKVMDYIRKFARERKTLTLKEDKFGNLLVRYRRGTVARGSPLLVFAAHTDHPGFIAGRRNSRKETSALFLGGVHKKFFKGSRVRFFADDGEVTGRITSVREGAKGEKQVFIATRGEVPEGTLGMWDLKGFRQKGNRIYSRAIDDLAGVSSVIALLDALHRGGVKGEAAGLFTRGEEAGLNGATGVALTGGLPRTRSRVVTVETSKELVNARVGHGPIIRVGDRKLIFDGPITRFIEDVAIDLAKREGKFPFQRRLMDGGTCESTSFGVLGYRTGAACVALGNYHNMSPDGRIREEYIHIDDLVALVRLFFHMVKKRSGIDKSYDRLRQDLVTTFEHYRPRLIARG